MKITTLRLFILIDILLVLLIYISPLNSNANWAFGLMIGFPMIILPPLIIIELLLTIFNKKISRNLKLMISLLSIPIVIIGSWKYVGWVDNIDNIIILPNDYKKNYLIIVYNVKTGNSINPDFSMKRKRKLIFPANGIFTTSTKLKSSSAQINSPRIFKSNGEEIKGTYYGDFFISNGFKQGYYYSIINLNEKLIYNMDSLFKADYIDFNFMDK